MITIMRSRKLETCRDLDSRVVHRSFTVDLVNKSKKFQKIIIILQYSLINHIRKLKKSDARRFY